MKKTRKENNKEKKVGIEKKIKKIKKTTKKSSTKKSTNVKKIKRIKKIKTKKTIKTEGKGKKKIEKGKGKSGKGVTKKTKITSSKSNISKSNVKVPKKIKTYSKPVIKKVKSVLKQSPSNKSKGKKKYVPKRIIQVKDEKKKIVMKKCPLVLKLDKKEFDTFPVKSESQIEKEGIVEFSYFTEEDYKGFKKVHVDIQNGRETIEKLMREENVNKLAEFISNPYKDVLLQLYSFYYFNCIFIHFNYEKYLFDDAEEKTDQKEDDFSIILRTRTASSYGKSLLFQRMSKIIGIGKSNIVNGIVKFNKKIKSMNAYFKELGGNLSSSVYDEGDNSPYTPSGINRDGKGIQEYKIFWNVVSIKQKNYFIDCTLGSGKFIGLNFIEEYNPFYFYVSPKRFIYDHLPNNPNNQFIVPPVSSINFQYLINPDKVFYNIGLIPINENSKKIFSVLEKNNYYEEEEENEFIKEERKLVKKPLCYIYKMTKDIDLKKLKVSIINVKVKGFSSFSSSIKLCEKSKSFLVDKNNQSKGLDNFYEQEERKFYYVQKRDLLFLYVFPSLKGFYKISLFMKLRNEQSFLTPLVLTYFLKVRSNVKYNMDFIEYKSNLFFPDLHWINPVQKELRLNTSINIKCYNHNKNVTKIQAAIGYFPKSKKFIENEKYFQIFTLKNSKYEKQQEKLKIKPGIKKITKKKTSKKKKKKGSKKRAVVPKVTKKQKKGNDSLWSLKNFNLVLPPPSFYAENIVYNNISLLNDENLFEKKLIILVNHEILEEDEIKRMMIEEKILSYENKQINLNDLMISFDLVKGYNKLVEKTKIVDKKKNFQKKIKNIERESEYKNILQGKEDIIENIVKNGAILKPYRDKGFKILNGEGFYRVEIGKPVRIELKVPKGNFVFCRFSRFVNENRHPCLVYYDPKTEKLTLNCFFLHQGSFKLSLFCISEHTYGKEELFGRLIISVKNKKIDEKKKPKIKKQIKPTKASTVANLNDLLLKTSQHYKSSVMVIIDGKFKPEDEYLIKKYYTNDLSAKCLVDENGKKIGEELVPQKVDGIQLMEWTGSLDLRVNNFCYSNDHLAPNSLQFLYSTECYAFYELNTIPTKFDTEEVEIGDEAASIMIPREYGTRAIHVPIKAEEEEEPKRELTLEFSVFNDDYSLNGSFIDFDFHTHGFKMLRQDHTYFIHLKVKRQGCYKLILFYHVKQGKKILEKPGPEYYVWFD